MDLSSVEKAFFVLYWRVDIPDFPGTYFAYLILQKECGFRFFNYEQYPSLKSNRTALWRFEK